MALTDNLVLQADLADNAASTTVVAQVGANGTLNGAGNTSASHTTGPNSYHTSGLLLDNVDDYLNFGNVLKFNLGPTDSLSISFWHKPAATSPSAYQVLWCKQDGNVFGSFLGIYLFRNGTATGDPYQFGFYNGSMLEIQGACSNTTAWRHIALINRGTGFAAGMEIYENGVLLTPTVNFDAWNGSTTATDAPIQMGSRLSDNYPINGSVAGLKLWTRALSAGEVAQVYALAPAVTYPEVGLAKPLGVNDWPGLYL